MPSMRHHRRARHAAQTVALLGPALPPHAGRDPRARAALDRILEQLAPTLAGGRYILDDAGDPVPCADLLAWATWYESADRTVARDEIDGYLVSTVFLAIDHGFRARGAPVLYETMVFAPAARGDDDYMNRYTTRERALSGHAMICSWLRAQLAQAGAAATNLLDQLRGEGA